MRNNNRYAGSLFYRPDSPLRDNLVIPGTAGDLIELSGFVRHKDCITPYKHAKVEHWHCSADADVNDSDEYRYRGTSYCDGNGKYGHDSNGQIKEFLKKNGLLWMKNEVFGESYEYAGDNRFEYGGMPHGLYERLQFDFKKDGSISLRLTALWNKGTEVNQSFTRI